MFVVLRKSVVRALLPALLISVLLFPPGGYQSPLLPLPVARAAALPELPRVYIDTTYTTPAGPTITVPAGGDFQAALDTAQPGSAIVLQAGATYVGNFTLPDKTGSGWIFVLSSALASLPPPGTRISPAQAGLMPKIVGNPAISAGSGAHHYRFVGIELLFPSSGTLNTVVDLNGSNNVVFDRCYIHGDATTNNRRGIVMNGTALAVVDSYLSNFHHATLGYDAQAIISYNGAGPYKIVNNYLEADTENVIFGGWDSSSESNIPSDIELRGNYFFKPLSWKIGDPSYAGIPWKVKNILEFKSARRVLVEGNVFENNWTQADQGGFAILFTPRNQQGTAPWSMVRDITFVRNIVKRSTAGVNILGWDNLQSSQETQRILIRDNLFVDIGIYPDTVYGGFFTGMLFMVSDGPADLVIDHNTAIQTGSPMHAGTFFASRWPATDFVFANNIMPNNQGVDGGGSSLQTLDTLFPGYVFARNALSGASASSYPLDNFFPATLGLVGFVNLAGGDYHLAPTSPYKYAGTDGKDLGADIDAINTATATAISGVGPVDTAAPSVALTAPSAGESVSGTITVSANAVDNVGVVGVQFKLNGSNLGSEDSTNAYAVSWDTTKVSNGSYTFTAVARDAAGNQTISTPVSVTVNNLDSTPPLISSVTVSSITPSGASITWATSEPSDSQVEYGLTMSYGSVTPLATAMITAHAVTLSSLAEGAAYHYRVKSRDAANNLAVSSDFTFTTAPAADTQPPSTPTGLTATAASASQINLAWSASVDNVAVTGYKVLRNGGQVAQVGSPAYQDTGLAAATTYAYTIAAYDAAGNTSAQSSPASATTLGVEQTPYKSTPWVVPGQIEAEDFDNGGEGVAYHDNVPGNAGGVYRTDGDVDIRRTPDGGVVVFNFETGEWLEYTISVDRQGTYRLDLLVSNQAWSPSPRWHAEIDGLPVTASVAVPSTGSWYTFHWVGVEGISLAAGQHTLRIVADQQYFDFAALRLKRSNSPFKGTPFSVPDTQIEAEDFDNGGEGVAYHDNVPSNAGGAYRTDGDVDIRQTSNGGVVVFNFERDEWLEYTINVTQTGTYGLDLLASSEWTTGRWHAEIDGVPVTASIAVPSTGSWYTFQWVGVDGIALTAGLHILRIVADEQYFDFAALRMRGPLSP